MHFLGYQSPRSHSLNSASLPLTLQLPQVRDNVAYDITGHAYFMEDGTETNNYVTGNLGIAIRRSSALLKVRVFLHFCVVCVCVYL